MDHPVRALAAGNQRVERPSRRPHQIAARLIVLRVLVRDAARVQDGAHQALTDIVARVIIRAGEILLADVGQLPATEVASLRESFDTSICLDRPDLLHSQSCEVQQRSGNYQSH